MVNSNNPKKKISDPTGGILFYFYFITLRLVIEKEFCLGNAPILDLTHVVLMVWPRRGQVLLLSPWSGSNDVGGCMVDVYPHTPTFEGARVFVDEESFSRSFVPHLLYIEKMTCNLRSLMATSDSSRSILDSCKVSFFLLKDFVLFIQFQPVWPDYKIIHK